MNTMVGTIPMDAILNMLNSLSHHDRKWLVEQISAQVEREETETEKALKNLSIRKSAWEEENQALYDEVFASFHSDWGGDGSATEIAESLRKGRVNNRKIEVW